MDNIMEVEKKLAASLTAESTELLPYLPYLLQDIDELGSCPADMTDLIKTHVLPAGKSGKVLDLACGKGTVSIKICQETGLNVKGVDLIPEFIIEAQKKAECLRLQDKCSFETGDINHSVKNERGYDIVIFGAAGDVLGTPSEELTKLKQVLSPGGYMLIDEAYLTGSQDEIKYQNYEYLTLDAWNKLFEREGIKVIEMRTNDGNTDKEINDYNNICIKKRAEELIIQHPEKKALFDGYVQSQLNECEDLDQSLAGVTWLLQVT